VGTVGVVRTLQEAQPMQLKRAVELFLEGYFSTCQRSEKTIQAYSIDLMGRAAPRGRLCLHLDPAQVRYPESLLRILGSATETCNLSTLAYKIGPG
jgi:hypothetical protein